MRLTPSAALARSLERHLGDPTVDDRATSYARALDHDAREAFPEEGARALDAWGLPRFYVPASIGGALSSLDDLLALVRVAARRDLTLAIAHAKTLLGVTPTWIAGTPAQARRLADEALAGAPVALALTEADHGGDLMATETRATRRDRGYALTGEKWLINNATRAPVVTVLARTAPEGGPRGLSLFLVRKGGAAGLACTPKIATHGIRGADISGLRFDDLGLDDDARLGAEGHGLEVTMKTLQITRALVPALSLGALDAGLRHVVRFARARRIGSSTVLHVPHARRVLAEAAVELLAAECVARSCARSAHASPERLVVASAVAKYLVPTRVDAALDGLATVLGARRYLRGDPLEKVRRDHALAPLFDGSAVVNLNALAQELPRLDAARDDRRALDRVAPIFRWHDAPPPLRLDALDLVGRGDDLFAPLAWARGRVADLARDDVEPPVRDAVRALLEAVDDGLRATTGRAAPRERPLAQSPEAFAQAARFARLHAAHACALCWVVNRDALDDFFARGRWLALALQRLVDPGRAAAQPGWYDDVLDRVCALDEAGRTLSFEPLAPGPDA